MIGKGENTVQIIGKMKFYVAHRNDAMWTFVGKDEVTKWAAVVDFSGRPGKGTYSAVVVQDNRGGLLLDTSLRAEVRSEA